MGQPATTAIENATAFSFDHISRGRIDRSTFRALCSKPTGPGCRTCVKPCSWMVRRSIHMSTHLHSQPAPPLTAIQPPRRCPQHNVGENDRRLNTRAHQGRIPQPAPLTATLCFWCATRGPAGCAAGAARRLGRRRAPCCGADEVQRKAQGGAWWPWEHLARQGSSDRWVANPGSLAAAGRQGAPDRRGQAMLGEQAGGGDVAPHLQHTR